jgi:hypothetical protein
MKNYFLNVFFAFSSTLLLAQVGVGTTTPSAASMLEISSTSDGGITYKGLMPPRVPDVTARDAIAATSTDIGLTVFVDNIDCLQIWNGTSWENIHCNNNVAFIGVVQNFDLGTSWGYTTDVPFFDNGVLGFYGITNASNSIFSNLTTLTNDFLGVRDLNDTEDGNGTDDFATITFNTIDVSSSLGGVTVAFDYDFFEFDNGDDAEYILIIDGISQTPVTLINGSGDLSLSGSISESIPGGTFSVALQVRIKQNGDDVGGFDNFRIF